VDLLVLAKEPIPGRVKTRLCPPCTDGTAAAIAAAALAATLDAACASGADRVVLALDGRPGTWCPPGVLIVPQGGGTLGDRLTSAWARVTTPALQVAMDTPHVGAGELDDAMGRLEGPAIDAVIGPAHDGGWWAIGFRRPPAGAFTGVPMSQPDTGARQVDRLCQLGLRVGWLPSRRDVDTWEDALAVARQAPGGRFARAVQRAAP